MEITYEEFRRQVYTAGCTAISATFRPQSAELAHTFFISVGELLSGNTYSVRSANPARTAFADYKDPDACALRFDELVASPLLIAKVLDERSALSSQPLTEANIVALRCARCSRRIVVDGLHRLARLASENAIDAPVHVCELSGENWPIDTPDFNVVCVCPRGQHVR
jgi:hypothetical protein